MLLPEKPIHGGLSDYKIGRVEYWVICWSARTTHSFACHALPASLACSAALIRSFAHLLTRSRAYEKEVYVYEKRNNEAAKKSLRKDESLGSFHWCLLDKYVYFIQFQPIVRSTYSLGFRAKSSSGLSRVEIPSIFLLFDECSLAPLKEFLPIGWLVWSFVALVCLSLSPKRYQKQASKINRLNAHNSQYV